MKIGDVSRRRRLVDPIRQEYYAWFRSVRFARRMGNLTTTFSPTQFRLAVRLGRHDDAPTPVDGDETSLLFAVQFVGQCTGDEVQSLPVSA